MSSIDALSIRGIRSFGPDEAQVIKFGKPLTVIIGENGCGKTTIIECLKYATTGSLPPGAGTGASFVHDPKIAGRSEVKAQIKLKFKNRVPQTMICVRDLQVTQARSKVTFKALECVLQLMEYLPDGTTEKRSATHACMRMDVLMPEMLGVPKAVLEHVVFCHQEDSNWPLQEGAKLKERFDAIFEASRYTKALEEVRKLRKDHAARAKEADAKLRVAEAQLNQLKSLRRKLADMQDARGVAEKEIEAEEAEIKLSEELVGAVKAQQAAVADLRRQIESCRAHVRAEEDGGKNIEAEIRRLPAQEAQQVERLRALTRAAFDLEATNVDRTVTAADARASERLAYLSSLRAKEQAMSREMIQATTALSDRIAARKNAASLEAEINTVASTVAREHTRALSSSSVLSVASSGGGDVAGGGGGSGSGGSGSSTTSVGSGSSMELVVRTPFVLTHAQAFVSRLSVIKASIARELAAFKPSEGEAIRDVRSSASNIAANAAKLHATQDNLTSELRRVRNDAQNAEYEANSLMATGAGGSAGGGGSMYSGGADDGHGSGSFGSFGGSGGGGLEGWIRSLQAESSRVSTELEELAGSHNPAATAQRSAQLQADIEAGERAIAVLRRMQSSFMQQSSVRAEADVLRTSANQKEERAMGDLRAARGRIDAVLAPVPAPAAGAVGGGGGGTGGAQTVQSASLLPPARFEEAVKARLAEVRRELARAGQQAAEAERKQSRAEAELRRGGKQLAEDLLILRRTYPRIRDEANAQLPRCTTEQLSSGLKMIVHQSDTTTQKSQELEEVDIGELQRMGPMELAQLAPPLGEEQFLSSTNWEMLFVNMLRSAARAHEMSLSYLDNCERIYRDGQAYLEETGVCRMCDRPVEGGGHSHAAEAIKAHVDTLIAEERSTWEARYENRDKVKGALDDTRDLLKWATGISPLVSEYDQAYVRASKMAHEELIDLDTQAADAARTSSEVQAVAENLRTIEAELVFLAGLASKVSASAQEAASSRTRAGELEASLGQAVAATGTDIMELRRAGVQVPVGGGTAAGGGGGGAAPPPAITLDWVTNSINIVEAKISKSRSESSTLAASIAERTKRQLGLQTRQAELQTSLATAQATEAKLAAVRSRIGELRRRETSVEQQLTEGTVAVRAAEAEVTAINSVLRAKEEAFSAQVSATEKRISVYEGAYMRLQALLERLKKVRIDAGLDAPLGSSEDASGGGSGSSQAGDQSAALERQLEELRTAHDQMHARIHETEKEAETLSKEARALSATKSVIGVVRRIHENKDSRARYVAQEDALKKKLMDALAEAQTTASYMADTASTTTTTSGGGGAIAVDDDDDNDDDNGGGGAGRPRGAAVGIGRRGSNEVSCKRRSADTDDNIIDLENEDGEDEQHDGRYSSSSSSTGGGGGGGKRPRTSSGATIGGADFSADPLAALDRQAAAIERSLSEHMQAKARLDGKLDQLRSSIDAARNEMKSNPELRRCEKIYKDSNIESTVLDNVVSDLDTYYKALDAALMRYHKLKVAEINSVIRDLWANTYQGADIDNIEIRSDLDDTGGAAGGAQTGNIGAGGGAGGASSSSTSTAHKGSKSYNYRVVMQKGDAELDMRGRCSAGQKVLASIVIRLALAESFCVNTGILALDEPTTNLDTANKRGLASSLARLIELRAGSNLQLIVITHDEEFVAELGRATAGGGGPSSTGQVGIYYRVSREEVPGRPGVFHSYLESLEDLEF